MPTTQNVAFLFVLVLALGFFSYNAQRLVRYLRIGLDEDRTDDPWTRPIRCPSMISTSSAQVEGQSCGQAECPIRTAVCWFMSLCLAALGNAV